MFKHSVKVPRNYKLAATITKKVVTEGGNLKSLLYDDKLKHFRVDVIFALIVETIKRNVELTELFKLTELFENEPRLDPWLAKVLAVELLFGKKKLPGQSKPETTITSYRDKFAKCIETISGDKEDKEETKPVFKPRFLRVNTNSLTTSDAIRQFQEDEYKYVRCTSGSYDDYLEQVKNLGEYEFMQDYHVKTVFVFPPKTHLQNHPFVLERKVVLQDKATTLAVHLLAPPPGSVVIDMCAAPGMKTTHLAAVMKNEGKVIAVEQSAERFKTLEMFIKDTGSTCVEAVLSDVLKIRKGQYPDVEYVLLDPSCTGSGMDRVLHTTVDENRIAKISSLQEKLLRHAMFAFPKAKRIVYSTCSLYPEENERVVSNAVNSVNARVKWRVQNCKELLKDQWNNFGSGVYGSMGVRCMYARSDSDFTIGFFLAVLERDFTKHVEKNEDGEDGGEEVVKEESKRDSNEENTDKSKIKKKNKKRGYQSNEEFQDEEGNTQINDGSNVESNKKKNKKRKAEVPETEHHEVNQNILEVNVKQEIAQNDDESNKKKNKKRKGEVPEAEHHEVKQNTLGVHIKQEITQNNDGSNVESKKKKNKKRKTEGPETEHHEVNQNTLEVKQEIAQNDDESNFESNKKKNKKRKAEVSETEHHEVNQNNLEVDVKQENTQNNDESNKKKTKKRKGEVPEAEHHEVKQNTLGVHIKQEITQNNDGSNVESKKKKNKKRKTEGPETEHHEVNQNTLEVKQEIAQNDDESNFESNKKKNKKRKAEVPGTEPREVNQNTLEVNVKQEIAQNDDESNKKKNKKRKAEVSETEHHEVNQNNLEVDVKQENTQNNDESNKKKTKKRKAEENKEAQEKEYFVKEELQQDDLESLSTRKKKNRNELNTSIGATPNKMKEEQQ